MTREKMLELRWKAAHSDQPGALYHGQRIIGYGEWKGGSLHMPSPWHVVVALADGSRIGIDEE
jgi:hypothetical protein